MRISILFLSCLLLLPLGGCGWLDEKPTQFQEIKNTAQSGVDAAVAETARLQAEADALRAKQDRTAEDLIMLTRIDGALATARATEKKAQDFLNDAQARLDAAPTNAALLQAAAEDYAGLLYPGAGILVALAGGWIREWTKKKQAVEQRDSIVSNIDTVKSHEKRDPETNKVTTVELDMIRLGELHAASGVSDVVDEARPKA